MIQALSHSLLVANLPFDFERLLEVLERVLRPVQKLVGFSEIVEHGGFPLAVVELDGKTESAIQVVQRILGVPSVGFHLSDIAQGFDMFGVSLQSIRIMLVGLVEFAVLLIERA